MAAVAGYYVAFSVTACFGRGLSRGFQAGFPDGQTVALIPVAESSGLAKGIALVPSTDEADDLFSLGVATGIAQQSALPPDRLHEGFAIGVSAPPPDDADDQFSVGLATGAAASLPAPDARGGFDDGFVLGASSGGSAAAAGAPTLSNITPDPLESPGDPGAFSVDFRVARRTPISFDVDGNGGAQIAINMSFADRNEVYVVLDFDGSFRWPFDVPSDNTIGDLDAEPVHVTLMPRGGWPPTVVRMQVATSIASAP